MNLDDLRAQFPRRQVKTLKLWAAILGMFDEHGYPVTVRQAFYLMVTGGHVPKLETQYRRVQRALSDMRRQGVIPYGYLADHTRWVRKRAAYDDLSDALSLWQHNYRREMWGNQKAHVEIWLEKDALAGVVDPISREYDVGLYVTRGYPSISYLYEAAESLRAIDKPKFIYHFGDYDASGKDAARSVREGLRELGAVFTFTEVAVTYDQIITLGLETRPAKRKDPRANRWGDIAVELDAIPPNELRRLVREVIEQHIDVMAMARLKTIEAEERRTIKDWGDSLEDAFWN